MTRGSLLGIALATIALTSAAVAQETPARADNKGKAPAAAPSGKGLPRTPWGDPDFQGFWTNAPYERTQQQDRQVRPNPTGGGPNHWYDSDAGTIIQLWQIPLVGPAGTTLPAMTPAGAKRTAALLEEREKWRPAGPEEMSPWDRCLTRGVPGMMTPNAYNNNYQILQAPGYVAILHEIIHDVRIIPIGRPHAPAVIRQWNGNSRGRWDGTTLVVETTNFTDRTQLALWEGFHSERLHLTERFIPKDANLIEYRFTVDDPGTWTQPWTGSLPLKRGDAIENRPLEYACHEGNYGIANILSGARAKDREEAAKGPVGR